MPGSDPTARDQPAARPLQFAVLLAALAIAGCATPPTAAPADADADVTVEGRITALDTSPWAYDGSAVMRVATASTTVEVALPARWNLCRASGIGEAGDLRVGERVRVVGRRNAEGVVTPCEHATHQVERLR